MALQDTAAPDSAAAGDISTITARSDGRVPSRGPSGDRHQGLRAGAGAAPSVAVKLLYGVLAAIVVGYWISLIVRPNGESWSWLDGWGVAGFELLVSVLVLVRAVVNRWDRRYATWLGLGMCSWSLGDLTLCYMSRNGANVPTPALPNYLWAGFFPLAYVGVMLLMQRDVRKLTAANFLDGVVAFLVTAAALVAFVFGAIQHAAGGSAVEVGTNLIYPLGDLLLFGLTAFGIVLLPAGNRLKWYLIAAAGLINAAGDIAALFPTLTATQVGFVLNSGAWSASLLCISAAVWLAPSPTAEPRESRASGFLIPTVASGFALVILFVGSLNHTSQVAIGLASATLLAAGVRFGLALRRMQQLTNEKHDELERAAAAERESRKRSDEASAAERKSLERVAAAERESGEREREFLERAAAAERDSREILEAAVRSYTLFAARVADGDLTATVEPVGDEDLQALAGSLNKMVAGLAEISGEIQVGVQEIGASTTQILASANEHSERASQQSAAISRTTATVNGLRTAADEMAQRAEDVARRASDSVKVSDEGTQALQAIAEAMDEIRARVDGIAQEIVNLSTRTQQIGDITATVNELADRSNLLALNASVEAARAGEHGRGFAVVADHVRDLSEQSKAATAKVEAILSEVRIATEAAVRASEQGSKVVDQGLVLTGRAGEGVRSLTDTIREAWHAAEQIAASAQQQSAGMDRIAGAMNELEDSTMHFLDGAQQSQRSAENLDELSAKLTALTDRYRVADADIRSRSALLAK